MERLGYAIDDAFYGLSAGHLETYRKMMDELTLDDVNKAIKKHFQSDNMQIAIITKNAQAFKDALVADSPSPITYGTPKSASVMEEDKEIMVFPIPVKANNVKIVPVTELFLK